jgi:addiction module HigA family antidote
MGVTPYELAKAIDVPVHHVDEIITGERSISADMAVRLGAFFGTNPQSWMELQANYDTEMAKEKIGIEKLDKIRRYAPICRSRAPGRP